MPYVALHYANGELVANITGTNLGPGAGEPGFANMYVESLKSRLALWQHLDRPSNGKAKSLIHPVGSAMPLASGRFTGISDT